MDDNHTRISVGKLAHLMDDRLSHMNRFEREVFIRNLVSYILRNCLDGGPLTSAVMRETYETANDLMCGGIDIPSEEA